MKWNEAEIIEIAYQEMLRCFCSRRFESLGHITLIDNDDSALIRPNVKVNAY